MRLAGHAWEEKSNKIVLCHQGIPYTEGMLYVCLKSTVCRIHKKCELY